ncbi:MAG: protein translocase subunit SecD [Fidelibacterota bacterium]|nr:MAG: protein translocase subunit SecD [Candidatus Neomarinimicrobiota bacterium]
MLNRPSLRFAIIGIVFLWVVWALLPTLEYRNLSDEEKDARRSEGTMAALEQRIINLGLDLQGGIHLVLEVDIPTLVRNLAENKDDRFEEVLAQTSEEIQATDADFFTVFRRRTDDTNLRLIRYFSSYGTKVPDIITALRSEADDAVNRGLEIIRNRVDQFGVAEPTIQKAGGRRIIVELAGIKDPAQARNLIQNTALLEFNLLQDLTAARDVMLKLDEVLGSSGASVELAEGDTATAPADTLEDALAAVLGGRTDTAAVPGGITVSREILGEHPFTGYIQAAGNNLVVPARYRYAVESLLAQPEVQTAIPNDGIFLWSNRTETLPVTGTNEEFYYLYYLYREPGLTGGVITEAKANLGAMGSSSANQPVVNVAMNNEGSKIWARLTGANVGRRVAIVLDKKIHMAPVIRDKIPGGQTVIEGMESMDEAKLIAIVLRAGSLPAPVDIIEERSIGPSLGHDSIQHGINAALIGSLLVIGFMVFYYKASGLLATLALVLNILVVLAALASLRATLTLPGIAGLILTVGMAVDANVLIFERIREELDKGKSVRAAIDSGYGRATITIIDANVTTILAALVLFQFGTGPIKGFAITLFWGILASMFTAIFMTRTIFMTITQSPKVKTLSI